MFNQTDSIDSILFRSNYFFSFLFFFTTESPISKR